MRLWSVFILSILLPLHSLASNEFYPSKYNLGQTSKALNNLKNKEWDEAIYNISSTNDPVIQNFFLVKFYSNPEAKVDLEKLKDFVKNNPHWPGVTEVQKRLEESFSFGNEKVEEIINWFAKHPPITPQGTKILAEAKFRNHTVTHEKGAKEEVRKLIRDSWIKASFSVKEEVDFLLKYNHMLSQSDHISRIDRLLWNDQQEAAERIIHKLNKNYQQVFKARIAIANNPQSIDKIMKLVPVSLKLFPGLLYETIVWYQKHDHHNLAFNLMKYIPKNHHHLKKWWKVRNRAVREALEMKNYQQAYNLVIDRGKLDPQDEPEAEWLAGWVSYSFLNKPNLAYNHFEKIYKISLFPINKARGAYWAGKAAKKLKKNELANKMFNTAASYPFTFYGQLANLKLNKEAQMTLESTSQNYTEQDKENFLKNLFAKAAYIASYFDDKESAKKYLAAALKQAKTKGEYSLIASIPKNMKEKWLSVHAAKLLSFNGVMLPQYNYPEIEFAKNCTSHYAFVHSIIRQESVFDISAVSPVGALGMMQIMPNVGKGLAKEIGVEFSLDKLLNDHEYNIKLGSYLLEKLLTKYNGSYILAAAAYNAGEAAVGRWIKKYGDPRGFNKTKEILNWIEHIPYYETRNYVLRVLETMQVYKALGNIEKPVIRLKSDLKGCNAEDISRT